MQSGIYSIDICGIVYIGSTKNFTNRLKRHLKDLQNKNHHNIILQRAFDKHGLENVKFSIIEEVPYEKNIILEREQFYIDKSIRLGRCANISDASFGDTKTNNPNREIIIEKTSKTLQNLMSKMSNEEKSKKFGNPGVKNGMHGKEHSEETKKKIGEKNKGKCGHLNGMYGKKHSIETRQRLSEYASNRTGDKNSFYGKEHSEETKKKIGEKNKGKIPGNTIKLSINDKVYSSYNEASRDLNIAVTTIRWRCLSENKKFEDYKIL